MTAVFLGMRERLEISTLSEWVSYFVFWEDTHRTRGSGVLLKMEVSIRCQKNPEVGIRRIHAYTPQYTTDDGTDVGLLGL